jgi:peroxiredoxin Q/BCP
MRGEERKAKVSDLGHAPLTEGDAAPGFSLPATGGQTVSLESLRGRKVVVYFYPKADTPACTTEAMDFSRLKADFEAAGTTVIGISGDPVKALDKFTTKRDLSIALASAEEALFHAYGVWVEKSMYGKTYMGLERATFLIDGEGKVARVWRKVKVAGHAEAVLEAAKAL